MHCVVDVTDEGSASATKGPKLKQHTQVSPPGGPFEGMTSQKWAPGGVMCHGQFKRFVVQDFSGGLCPCPPIP